MSNVTLRSATEESVSASPRTLTASIRGTSCEKPASTACGAARAHKNCSADKNMAAWPNGNNGGEATNADLCCT